MKLYIATKQPVKILQDDNEMPAWRVLAALGTVRYSLLIALWRTLIFAALTETCS